MWWTPISDELDCIEEDLDNIDDYLMDDEDYDDEDDYEDADEADDEYDFGDETLYEVKCPTCGEVITGGGGNHDLPELRRGAGVRHGRRGRGRG